MAVVEETGYGAEVASIFTPVAVDYRNRRFSGLAQRKKCFLGGIQGQLNVFRRMRTGHETRFIRRRRQVYPLFQHGREKAPEGIAITGGGLGEVIHPALA